MSGMNRIIGALVGGVLVLVIGLVLEATIITNATTAGGHANIGSFSGAQDINDLIPLVYNVVVLSVGIGLIGLSALGFVGVGPASRR